MEKLNRAKVCSILGTQNPGSGGTRAPGPLPDPHLGSLTGRPHTVKSEWYASYWNAFLLKRISFLQEKPKTANKNKLSSRRRCIPTPDEEVLESKEEGYINDAIRAERRRTKYRCVYVINDVIIMVVV